MGYWRMICTEVCLRRCRDVLGRRLGRIADSLGDAGESLTRMENMKDEKFKEKSAEDKVKKDKFKTSPAVMIHEACSENWKEWLQNQERYLRNLSLVLEFWKPLESMTEWALCSWNMQFCNAPQLLECKSQILERRKELQSMMKYALEWAVPNSAEMKIYMMEDMPGLVQDFLKDVEGAGGSSMEAVVQQQPMQRKKRAS